MRSLYDHGSSTISETLDILDKGLRRLGIIGHGFRGSGLSCVQADMVHVSKDLPRYQPVTPEMLQRIKHLTREGRSQMEIARMVGCSQSAVSKNLTRLGIRQRTRRAA